MHSVRPDIVRLGEQNLVRTDDRASPLDLAIDEVIVHPSYKTSSHYSDIAVVKLAQQVAFNKFIRPACLWQNYDVNSTRAVATGWGQVEFCEFLNSRRGRQNAILIGHNRTSSHSRQPFR